MMPEWAVVLLSIAGALILVLLAIIGNFYRREWKRQDEDKKTLSQMMADGFAELKTLVSGVSAQAQRLERECVTREEFNKLKADVTHHSTEIAVIKTTCQAERGK